MVETLSHTLIRTAQEHSSNFAIVNGSNKSTYQQLEKLFNRLKISLVSIGVQPNDVVAVSMENSAEQLALFWAINAIGAVICPLRRQANPKETRELLQLVGISYFIIDEITDQHSFYRPVISYDLLVNSNEVSTDHKFDEVSVSAKQTALIAFSSGSTGEAKVFAFNNIQVLDNARQNNNQPGWTHEDVFFLNMSMGDTWGCSLCLAMLIAGGTIYIQQSLDSAEVIDELCTSQTSSIVLLPWQIRILSNAVTTDALKLSSIKSVLTSASPLTRREKLQFLAQLGPCLYDAYGTTEMHFISVAGPEDILNHSESVGRAAPGVEIQIVDEHHQPLPENEIGLIRARKPHMFNHYIDNSEATEKGFRDGWFYPLDFGYLDKDGYLYLMGRSDDMIIFNGAKFYPVEVERVIDSYPLIQEVVVFGRSDARFGEVAAAAIVSEERLNPVTIINFCQQKLEQYKIPRFYISLKKIPRNANGKVIYKNLEQRLDHELRLASDTQNKQDKL